MLSRGDVLKYKIEDTMKTRSIYTGFFCLLMPVLLLPAFPLYGQGSIPLEEREALIAFYNATNGDHWKKNGGWKLEPLEDDGFAPRGSEGSWSGIKAKNGHVTEIRIKRFGLEGTLPRELGNLRYLRTLFVFGEIGLQGHIPPELAKLERLEELVLAMTQISGSIPPQLGHLTALRELRLASCLLEGIFPPELARLEKLQMLAVSHTGITGPIPPALGNLAGLRELDLSGSQMTGSIPAELGYLSNLEILNLSGDIPRRMGAYVSRKGDKPFSYKDYLERLKASGLRAWQFSGPVPPELGNLHNLTVLNLSRNRLIGSIPFEFGNLSNLKKLFLFNNRLDGPIPGELGNLLLLEDIVMSVNRLSGRIPPELGNLYNLKYLQLEKNNLSGPIPRSLGGLVALKQLRLASNGLKGPIPPGLTTLSTYHVSFEYNGLYTGNNVVRWFMKKRNALWEDTQTIAPGNVKAVPAGAGIVRVSWRPIKYKDHGGGYTVFYGPSIRGPWTEAGTTKSKKTASMDIRGLEPGKTYYFIIQTHTPSHDLNPNDIISDTSSPCSCKAG